MNNCKCCSKQTNVHRLHCSSRYCMLDTVRNYGSKTRLLMYSVQTTIFVFSTRSVELLFLLQSCKNKRRLRVQRRDAWKFLAIFKTVCVSVCRMNRGKYSLLLATWWQLELWWLTHSTLFQLLVGQGRERERERYQSTYACNCPIVHACSQQTC